MDYFLEGLLEALGVDFAWILDLLGGILTAFRSKTLQRFVLFFVVVILLNWTGMGDIWEDLGEIWNMFWRCLGILANKHEFQDGSKTVTGVCHSEESRKASDVKAKSRKRENENEIP